MADTKDYSKVKFADLKFKKDRVACIRWRLAHDYKWAWRALTVIYANQTADEQRVGATTDHNGIGFTGVDAEFLSSLAEQLEQRGSLSPKQNLVLFKMMPKYAVQLERTIPAQT